MNPTDPSTQHASYEAPAWTRVPGFDRSLQRLPLGQRLRYALQPRALGPNDVDRGFWCDERYESTVIKAERRREQRKMLRSDRPLTFCWNVDVDMGAPEPHWFLQIPAGTLHDGSTVSIARWHTGSGISRDLAPAGLLHDYATRRFLATDGKIEVKLSLHPEAPIVRRVVTLADLARLWGAAVQSVSPSPPARIRFLQFCLRCVHPIFIMLSSDEPWRESTWN